jgi:hypothetical protein
MGKSKLPFLGQSGIASADASRVPHIQAKKEQVRSRSQEIGWLLWALQYVFYRRGAVCLCPLREQKADAAARETRGPSSNRLFRVFLCLFNSEVEDAPECTIDSVIQPGVYGTIFC